jgi:hypothetical protein
MVTLPKPNGGFRWVQLEAGPGLMCEALQPVAAHFFTTRSWRIGERTTAAEGGWEEVAAAAHVDIARLGRLHQVHGAAAATYKKGGAGPAGAPPHADIVLTDDPSIAVGVHTADCLPILIVDRRTHAVAAAHAGWRGLAARVPAVAVDRIATDFGSRVDDLLVAVGPAIGACCYEVGEDVRVAFAQAGFVSGEIDRWCRARPSSLEDNPPMRTLPATRRPDHWFFDGWSCVREQLESAGVPGDQIFIADLCTASHEAAFCSYRRDGPIAGRMAAVMRSNK